LGSIQHSRNGRFAEFQNNAIANTPAPLYKDATPPNSFE